MPRQLDVLFASTCHLTTITQLDPISRIENVNSDWRDLNWVDKFNTLGLGSNVPFKGRTHFANSSTSDKNDNVFLFWRDDCLPVPDEEIRYHASALSIGILPSDRFPPQNERFKSFVTRFAESAR